MEKNTMTKQKTVFERVIKVLKNRKKGLTSKEIAEKTGANWHSVRRELGTMGPLLVRREHAPRGLLYTLAA